VNSKQTYTFINPTQLAESYNNMTAPINFQYPIETLFKHIEDRVRYANTGMQQYMEAPYTNIAFLLILNTGAIHDAYRDWQNCTPVNQTWADLRCEFAGARREQRIISNTDRGAGYHTAIVAEHYVQSHIPANGGFITAMAHLATVASADCEIATLTDQLAAKDMWYTLKKAEC
jgi:hypothetical protein